MTESDTQPFTDADAAAILAVWFGEHSLTAGAPAPPDMVQQWFLGTPEFRRTCAGFGALLADLGAAYAPATIAGAARTPARALALLVLLCPLARILFSATPAEASIYRVLDPLAEALAAHALDPARRWDLGVDGEWKASPAARMWFLLPGGNSEVLAVQEKTVRDADEVVKDAGAVVGGVWDGNRVAEAMNLRRFLLGRCEEVRVWGRMRERDAVLGREVADESIEGVML